MGSFLIAKNGVRWIDDIGKENYSQPNFFRGIDKPLDKNGRPGNNRWQYFRNNCLSHSVLTFDGRLQNPNGYGSLYAGTVSRATFDISQLYAQSPSKVVRRFFIENENNIRISDSFVARSSAKKVRWAAIVCNKEITVHGATATLQTGNYRASLKILAPANGLFQVESMDAELANNQSPHFFGHPRI